MPLDLIRRNGCPLLLVVILVMFEIAGDGASSMLRYDRSAILDGQVWRLLSAQFIHLGWGHLGMNLAGLSFIWLLAGKWLTLKKILSAIILSALTIGLGLLAINPEVSWYVGFSGTLHGIWAIAAMSGLRTGQWEAYALFILLVIKLGWEQVSGPLPGSIEMAGGHVIVDAHLYGGLSGILLWAIIKDTTSAKVE